MRKYAGAVLVVLGVVLTTYGLNSPESLNTRVSQLFSRWPVDGPTCLLIGGILSVMTGLGMAAHRRPRAS
ncbi:MAG: DUF3185 family protein [Planctomycetes bacterium]|nr:DUF3185 family protein [Planctomycetota bacterium]